MHRLWATDGWLVGSPKPLSYEVWGSDKMAKPHTCVLGCSIESHQTGLSVNQKGPDFSESLFHHWTTIEGWRSYKKNHRINAMTELRRSSTCLRMSMLITRSEIPSPFASHLRIGAAIWKRIRPQKVIRHFSPSSALSSSCSNPKKQRRFERLLRVIAHSTRINSSPCRRRLSKSGKVKVGG